MLVETRSLSVKPSTALRSAFDELPKRLRARWTNDALAGVDRTTARGRRIADLIRCYLSALPNAAGDVGRQAEIIAAAELQVIAEETRAAALREPEKADLNEIVRMQGAADRALRRLGIKPSVGSHVPTLAEYLAGKGRPAEFDYVTTILDALTDANLFKGSVGRMAMDAWRASPANVGRNAGASRESRRGRSMPTDDRAANVVRLGADDRVRAYPLCGSHRHAAKPSAPRGREALSEAGNHLCAIWQVGRRPRKRQWAARVHPFRRN